jgi:hypothetical protein
VHVKMEISPSTSALRLCACRTGEVVDGVRTSSNPHAVQLGTVVEAHWDPLHHTQLGILYSSGTLRIWDVVRNEYKDYALYFPVAGLPSAPSESLVVQDRRSAAPIAHFDFVPVSSGTVAEVAIEGPTSRVVISIKRTKRVYVVDVPAEDSTVKDHYLSGSILYDCKPDIPSEASVIRSFLVAKLPVPFACVAIGCNDGSLHVWGVSATLNPSRVAPGRREDASPRVIRLRSFGPAAAPSSAPSAPRTTAAVLSGEGNSVPGAHSGRIRAIAHIPLTQPGVAGAEGDGASAAAAAATADANAATYVRANNLFATAGADGRVRLWMLAQCDPDTNTSSELSITVQHLADAPCDGVPSTALAAATWPWHLTQSPAQRAAAALAPQPGRALLAVGNAEGVVTLWQVLVPHALRNLTQSSEQRSNARDAGRFATSAFTRPLEQALEVHLTGMVSTENNEPVLALTLSPSATSAVEPYKLSVALAGGQLGVYAIHGSAHAPNVYAPITIALQGQIGEAGPSMSSYDVIRSSMGPQAVALARLAAEAGDDQDTGSRATVAAAAVSGSSAQLSSALTAAAVAQLQRTFVSCEFNDIARGEGRSGPTVGALVACTGGGEIMLYTRDALPGDPEPAAEADAEAEAEAEAAAAAQAEAEAREADKENAAKAAMSPQKPSKAKDAATSTSADDDDDDDGDDEDASPRSGPPVAPTATTSTSSAPAAAAAAATAPSRIPLRAVAPRVLDQTQSSAARAAAASATVTKLEKQQQENQRSRLRARPHSRSRSYLRMAAADAVRSAYNDRTVTGGASSSSSVAAAEEDQQRHARRSISPVDRAHKRFVAPPRMPAAKAAAVEPLAARGYDSDGGYSDSGSSSGAGGGRRFGSRGSRGSREDSWAALKPGLHALDATRTGASSVSASMTYGLRTADVTAADVTANLLAATAATRGSAGAAPPGGSPTDRREALRQRLHAKTSGPYLDVSFRSPAKVAALVERDASLNIRAGALVAKQTLGDPGAEADAHPTAVATYGHVRASASHLVAPSLGSSAAIALEIRRIESAAFDERAALRDILRARKVTDAVVTTILMQRAGDREAAAASGESEETAAEEGAARTQAFAYEPGVYRPAQVFDVPMNQTLYDTSVLPNVTADYEDERERSRSRSKSRKEGGTLRPSGASPSPQPRMSESVTAEDVLHWNKQLRGSGAGARSGGGGGGGSASANVTRSFDASAYTSAHTSFAYEPTAAPVNVPAPAAVRHAVGAAATLDTTRARGRVPYRAGQGFAGQSVVPTINYNPVVRTTKPELSAKIPPQAR